jgi:hypothetical protein
MARVGHEHPPLTPPKTPVSTKSGAESDAHDAPTSVGDPDLAAIVAAWPRLPEHIKAAIRTLANTSAGD